MAITRKEAIEHFGVTGGKVTPKMVRFWCEQIDQMSYKEVCRLWRFGSSEHPIFQVDVIYNYYEKRYDEYGRISPEMSKIMGWEGTAE